METDTRFVPSRGEKCKQFCFFGTMLIAKCAGRGCCVHRILELGVATQLAKIDITSAYRIVPVHPQDLHLLGMTWGRKVYIDSALPHSAPIIFNALADALE